MNAQTIYNFDVCFSGVFAKLRFEKIGKKIKKWKVLSLAKQEAQWVILLTALADRKDLGGF